MFQDDNNSSSKLSWLNGSPGSFQNWRKPKQPFLGLKKEFHFGHDISVFQESESALYPYVSTRMYTAFMIYSTIDMKWVTVPCQLEFTNVLLICQHHNNTHHDGRSNTTSTQMYRQYRECLHDWVVIEDACHQMIDIRGNLNLTCNDFTGICQQYGAHLYMHETRNNAQVGNISKNLFYFSSWSYGTERIIFATSHISGQRKCGAWQILQRLTPILTEVTKHNNGSVVCQSDPIVVNSKCHLRHFRCADGSCILTHYECDGFSDCSDGSDELDCSHVCTFMSGSLTKDLSSFTDCFSTNCTCHDVYHQCHPSGGCIPASKLCDGTQDCRDDEDEVLCSKLQPPYNCYLIIRPSVQM